MQNKKIVAELVKDKLIIYLEIDNDDLEIDNDDLEIEPHKLFEINIKEFDVIVFRPNGREHLERLKLKDIATEESANYLKEQFKEIQKQLEKGGEEEVEGE